MNIEILAFVALGLAATPCCLFLINLLIYRPLPRSSALHSSARRRCSSATAASVLIPARNEEANIRRTLESVLANQGVDFEVVVLDDHSTDRTAEIVREVAARDSRLRLELAPPLLTGWCGKQHACHVLAQRANKPLLVFMDADVRLTSDALVRMTEFMNRNGQPSANSSAMEPSEIMLASGVPQQELGTISERSLIPLIHFILLGYLPMPIMRRTKRPAYSAGCGQLFIARRDAYEAIGGHAMIRSTLHDGVKLPRLFRNAGFQTDLFDATDIASCRMYRTNGETWRGLGKNATEGLGSPGMILPMTILLFGGQVLPFLLVAFGPLLPASSLTAAMWACAFAYLPRLLAVPLFRQPMSSALLHPVGIAMLLVIQWLALVRLIAGKPAVWKGRSYGARVAEQPVKAG